ncbi:MAG: thioredoxin domain-containing protein [Acidobacteria bacterium]|nr:thioredoxin domain-containing protein [Acidobacteriota bacterium]MCW5949210.1 thioredoxin domain-containing protein [Pyrinomonadaceae bacterium]
MSSDPKTPNRLIDETSPYLLQHAYNPVDWWPWCDEAFEKARNEDKPVLVSIGYSACHWCHVMENESFEDAEVAAIQNENFINIKVDMEERPDVDQVYMNFVQMTTGRGGWPMNVFVTADKRPFFGGTYFPPQPRYGMPSWRQILMSISEAYRERRDEIDTSALEIAAELRRAAAVSSAASGRTDVGTADAALESFVRSFDATHGGFGGAPKFPAAMSIEFLLRHHDRTGSEKALEMVTHTLDKMARGGIYDQLGGGFHRYSVDQIWLVPHFEKMLYDNAQLARVYLHAFQVTGRDEFRQTAVETLEYIRREMLDPSGGFYSTQDADSEGEEGKFFVWKPEEIAAVLGEADARIFNFYFDVSTEGNFEGHNILNRRYTVEAAAAALKIDEQELIDVIASGRQRLFADREARIKPRRDEKVLSAWNGLMLAAFADAACVLGDAELLNAAKANADFLLAEMMPGGRLMRTWKDGVAKIPAYLDDHANVADGLLELYRATGDIRYLSSARSLADTMIKEFWDAENGGFYYTSTEHEELVVRNKDFYDNATPSGNSVAAEVMMRLARLTGDGSYDRYATSVLRLYSGMISRHPQAFGRALSALEFYVAEKREVVIAGPAGNELERLVDKRYLPCTIVVRSRDAANDAVAVPLLEARAPEDGLALAYVCRDMVCERPARSAAELSEMLG